MKYLKTSPSNTRSKALAEACLALSLSLGLTACFAPPSVATKNAPANSPVVEAWIEYPGPPAQWAGPQSLTLQISAKNGGEWAELKVLPNPTRTDWVPGGREAAVGSSPRIASLAAKAELARLEEAVQKPTQEFTECLYPVRLRLVRADGSTIERQGCRSATGWEGVVSRVTHQWINQGMNSEVAAQAEPSVRAPASTKP